MSINPNPEKEDPPRFNSHRATEFILFVIGAAVLITMASVVAEIVQTTRQ